MPANRVQFTIRRMVAAVAVVADAKKRAARYPHWCGPRRTCKHLAIARGVSYLGPKCKAWISSSECRLLIDRFKTYVEWGLSRVI
jgi:hypothetical protein